MATAAATMATERTKAAAAPAPATGRDHFVLAFLLALAGWIGCVALQAALYLRPAPHGGAFLAEWERYFWLALYYDLMGVWLLSLPFFLLWLVLWRRALRGRAWRAVSRIQAALLAINLVLSALDQSPETVKIISDAVKLEGQ